MAVPVDTSHPPARTGRSLTDVVAFAGFAAVVLSLWTSWHRFPSVWSAHREHGFAVAALTLWLLWRDRGKLAQAASPRLLLAVPLLLASMLWMVGVVVSAQVVHLFLAPVILLGWLATARGLSASLQVLPVALMFMLAVPVWELLVPALQQVTVTVNQVAIAAVNLDAQVTGTSIKLAYGTLVVAESCAGLNYLLSGLTLGSAYALSFTTDLRTQLKLVATAAGLAIVSNWIRVFGLVIVADVTRMQSSLMQSHGVYGWVIFAGTLPLFGWLAARIERSQPVATTEPMASSLVAERGTSASSGATSESTNGMASMVATIAAVSGPALLLALQALHTPAPTPSQLPGVFPNAGWVVVPPVADAWRPSFAGHSEHRRYAFANGTRRVRVDRFVYATQSQDAELVGGSSRVAPDSLVVGERVVGPLDGSLRTVRETLVADGTGFRLVWWWYRAADSNTPMGTKAQLLEFWGLLTGTSPPEVIVVSAPCSNRDCLPARASLHEVVIGRPLLPEPTR